MGRYQLITRERTGTIIAVALTVVGVVGLVIGIWGEAIGNRGLSDAGLGSMGFIAIAGLFLGLGYLVGVRKTTDVAGLRTELEAVRAEMEQSRADQREIIDIMRRVEGMVSGRVQPLPPQRRAGTDD